MGDVVMEFKSNVGDGIKVYEDKIVISHTGALNFLAMGAHGDKTIYYADLTSVQFKKAGFMAGQLQFSLNGGRESTGGIFAGSGDENTITFEAAKNDIAEKVANYIQEKIREAKQPKAATIVQQSSPADEIKKYKELLDMGAISQEEFDAKKKQILGL